MTLYALSDEKITYTNQSITKMIADAFLEADGPPNSPPINNLLIMKRMKQQIEVPKYKATEKARSPGGT